MLNPQMKGWGFYEFMCRKAEARNEQHTPEPPKPEWAPGSLEWHAEEAKRKAQMEAAAVEGTAGLSPSGPHPESP